VLTGRFGIGKTRRESLRVVPSLIKLPQREQPGIGRKLPFMLLDNDGQMWEKIEVQLQSSLRRHTRPPCSV